MVRKPRRLKLSLKDEVEYVKGSLNSDEKILENAFKLERIYKKHKIKIWATVAALTLFLGGSVVMQAYQDSKMNAANEALLTLQTNPDDASALSSLKDNNIKLYELFSYSEASKNKDIKALETLSSSDDALVADLSKYHAGILDSKVVDSKYYQELVLVEEAFVALKSGTKDLAKQKLALIGENSPVSNTARLLKHYTIGVK